MYIINFLSEDLTRDDVKIAFAYKDAEMSKGTCSILNVLREIDRKISHMILTSQSSYEIFMQGPAGKIAENFEFTEKLEALNKQKIEELQRTQLYLRQFLVDANRLIGVDVNHRLEFSKLPAPPTKLEQKMAKEFLPKHFSALEDLEKYLKSQLVSNQEQKELEIPELREMASDLKSIIIADK